MERLVEELYTFKSKVENCENDYIISVQEKLRKYEDLDERIGVPLEELAKLCDKHIPKDCQNPNKAIVLTDEDVDRWNEYKNAEEQGLLLLLPCAIGSTLYQPIDSRINEYKVIGLCFDIFNNKWMYEVAYEVGLEWHKTVCNFDYIGKTVFLQ